MSAKEETEVKKQVSVSAISTLVTGTREEAVEAAESVGTTETIKTAEVGKDNKESKGEYSNLV